MTEKTLPALILLGLTSGAFAQNAGAQDAGPASFDALDANRDGRISVSEARKDKAVASRFASADTNQDGYLDRQEFAAIAR